MSKPLRSAQCTQGRRMAGARALWRANGMKEEQIGKPVIAVVNSFTQFVPGHTHLHEIGQFVKQEIEKLGCFAAEFNTIAIDDGIAMGHDGMLYSLPSRDLIADSVEYMVNAHKADAMVCISNCDKITPGMLMAAMRLNIPAIFVSGGPMEAGHLGNRPLDLIDVMIDSADTTVDDATVTHLEQFGCPTCGSCSGMFTANSMNCLNEAIGLALPGNGTILATHTNRKELFRRAAAQIVENCRAYYFDDDASVLPRYIQEKEHLDNAGMQKLINKQSGLTGISGISSDMRDIDAAIAAGNERARLALDMYRYRIVKYVGAYTAALGGVDVIVFTAGVGENQIQLRESVCKQLEFLGIDFDPERNNCRGEEVEITRPGSKVRVVVIPTDEEYMIACDTKSIVEGAKK